MPRDDVMTLMKSLKFIAIPKAYDEVLASARKRRQTTETVVEQLLEIEVSERQARSIRYRMTQARFPVTKDGKRRRRVTRQHPRAAGPGTDLLRQKHR